MTKPQIKYAGKNWRFYRMTGTKLTFVTEQNQLADWRKRRGLSQEAAAKELGISQGQVARIEAGTRICPAGVLDKIRDAKKS